MTSDTLSRQGLAEFAARRRPDFERWLRELVNVPSVSVDPIRRDDLRRCAEIALDVLTEAGVPEVELIETGGHPIVHGATMPQTSSSTGNKPKEALLPSRISYH